MKDYLQHYTMKLTALAPIHVGNGRLIGKKEYIQYGMKSPVTILNQEKMIRDLCLLHKENAYAAFMLSDDRRASLAAWLTEQRIDKTRIQKWASYTLDAGDAFITPSGKGAPPKEINCFCKDAYGMAYVPGSTLKGMIRTALLVHAVKKDPASYERLLEELDNASHRGGKRNSFLLAETQRLEMQAFHTLERPETKVRDAVNSVMSGLVVGDSKPIPVTQLMLCQKIDYSLERREKPLPTLREALKPGTEVLFDLTIDSQLFPYKMEDILEALNEFQADCYEYFYQRFGRGKDAKGIVWVGGGVGFLSKTILYSLYGDDAVPITDNVFRTTLSGKIYDQHKHSRDLRLGIAPHVCKCTRYQGRLYDMGMGKLEIVGR